MVKKTLLSVVILFTAFCVFGFFMKDTTTKPEGTMLDRKGQFSRIPEGDPPAKTELPPLIKEINERNAKIRSMACDDVQYVVWQNGHRYKLNGSLHYEKPLNFRMKIDSVLGREVDVGSNDKHFWYWSRRDKSPGLHYISHEDSHKARLKAPFNPVFLRATLGFEVLPDENVKVVESATDIMLVYPRPGANGRPLLFSVLVNKESKKVDGYVVTNEDGKNVAACEIQQYSGDVPVKILYSWYEEDRAMLVLFNKPKLNTVIAPNTWSMPDYTPRLNMAEGHF